jgi:hypothetical protein
MRATDANGWLKRPTAFWRDLLEPRTYLNIAYLLLGFPLGMAYFGVLVTGVALGFGLSITFLGIPVLLGVVGFVWVAGKLEREMALFVLGQSLNQQGSISAPTASDEALIAQDTPNTASRPTQPDQTAPFGTQISSKTPWWTVLKSYLSSLRFWKAFVHHVLKFPLGIASFVAVVVMASVALALAGLPLYAPFTDVQFSIGDVYIMSFWQVTALTAVGIGLLLISARVLNLMAEAQARWTLTMLDNDAQTVKLEPDSKASNLKP